MDFVKQIEERWLARAKTLGYRPKTVKYRKAEVEFFAGAMSAIHAMDPEATEDRMSNKVPTRWIIHLMAGDPVVVEETK